jgi:hypothetical protein
MQRIQDYWLKIKTLAEEAVGEWGLFLIVILASLGAFGLGRLSALEAGRPDLQVQNATQAASGGTLLLGGSVVASRTGEVYYYPWCSGAANIKPENQRVFASVAAAQKAGYRAAKNCKGLE